MAPRHRPLPAEWGLHAWTRPGRPQVWALGGSQPAQISRAGVRRCLQDSTGHRSPWGGGRWWGAGLGRQVGAPRLRALPPSSPGEWQAAWPTGGVLTCLMVGMRRRGGAGPVAAAPCPPLSEEMSLRIFLLGSHCASGSENWGHSTERTFNAEKRLLSQVGPGEGVMALKGYNSHTPRLPPLSCKHAIPDDECVWGRWRAVRGRGGLGTGRWRGGGG